MECRNEIENYFFLKKARISEVEGIFNLDLMEMKKRKLLRNNFIYA